MSHENAPVRAPEVPVISPEQGKEAPPQVKPDLSRVFYEQQRKLASGQETILGRDGSPEFKQQAAKNTLQLLDAQAAIYTVNKRAERLVEAELSGKLQGLKLGLNFIAPPNSTSQDAYLEGTIAKGDAKVGLIKDGQSQYALLQYRYRNGALEAKYTGLVSMTSGDSNLHVGRLTVPLYHDVGKAYAKVVIPQNDLAHYKAVLGLDLPAHGVHFTVTKSPTELLGKIIFQKQF